LAWRRIELIPISNLFAKVPFLFGDIISDTLWLILFHHVLHKKKYFFVWTVKKYVRLLKESVCLRNLFHLKTISKFLATILIGSRKWLFWLTNLKMAIVADQIWIRYFHVGGGHISLWPFEESKRCRLKRRESGLMSG
jgi:hypothetical protein